MVYIDANALLENLKKQYGEDLGWQCTVNMSDVGMMIEDAPTADVVEVVYCKGCKYNENNICIHPDNITHSYDCEENIYDHYINVYSDHFCSYGERRTDNDV